MAPEDVPLEALKGGPVQGGSVHGGSVHGDSVVPKPQVKLLLVIVFLSYLGQMAMSPVIAPLSRKIRLDEWQVGITISIAAVMVVIASQFWGRWSQSWGCKRVLIYALILGSLAMLGFVILAQLGMNHTVTGTPLFLLFILFRGVLFGTAIAAVAPTAQAYIAKVTFTESERVNGMAAVGAAQGLAMVGGAMVGGVLAGISIMLSLSAIPVLLFAAVLLVIFRLDKEPASALTVKPPYINPLDTRVWPFLVAGFGMFSGLGFIQIISGFIVQDRFRLDSETTGFVTGVSLLASGIGIILAQSVIVPRSNWRPATMLRIGSLIATVGFGMLFIDLPLSSFHVPLGFATLGIDLRYVLFFSAMFIIALGIGITMPGYTAGASMLMKPAEQGGLAGLIASTLGLTFVVAPTASTVLYALWPALPILVGGLITLLVFIFVWLHPRFRQMQRRDLVQTSA